MGELEKIKFGKEMVFSNIDMNFNLMLKFKQENNPDLVYDFYNIISATLNTLNTLRLINSNECKFIKRAINFVWLEMEVA